MLAHIQITLEMLDRSMPLSACRAPVTLPLSWFQKWPCTHRMDPHISFKVFGSCGSQPWTFFNMNNNTHANIACNFTPSRSLFLWFCLPGRLCPYSYSFFKAQIKCHIWGAAFPSRHLYFHGNLLIYSSIIALLLIISLLVYSLYTFIMGNSLCGLPSNQFWAWTMTYLFCIPSA